MLRFPVTRLAGLVITLLAASFLIFSSLYLTPGNPISTLSGGRTLPPEAVEAVRQQYHLDDPFLLRYLAWLGDVVRGARPGRTDPDERILLNPMGMAIEDVACASAVYRQALAAAASLFRSGASARSRAPRRKTGR